MLVARPQSRPSLIARAAYAQFAATVTMRDPEAVVKTMRGADELLPIVSKAAVAIGTSGASGWASQLVQTGYGEYLGWLAPESAASRLISLGLTVPMPDGVGQFGAPKRDTEPAVLPWVGEEDPIPARALDFNALALAPRKMAAISVISRELAKRSDAEATVTTLLREDGGKSLDAAYFSATAGDADAHAGLLNGLSAVTAYAGGDEAAFLADMDALLDVVGPNGSGNVVLVTGPARALRIAVKFPDFRLPVFASQAVAETRLIAIDAGALVHSFGGYEIDVADQALVHMDDSPLPISATGSPNTVAAPTRSLFQTNCAGIRIIGYVAFAARKADAIAYIDGPTW